MNNPVVTGGSGEQSKTIMIKEEDLQVLFHKMMGQTKQEVPTKTVQDQMLFLIPISLLL